MVEAYSFCFHWAFTVMSPLLTMRSVGIFVSPPEVRCQFNTAPCMSYTCGQGMLSSSSRFQCNGASETVIVTQYGIDNILSVPLLLECFLPYSLFKDIKQPLLKHCSSPTAGSVIHKESSDSFTCSLWPKKVQTCENGLVLSFSFSKLLFFFP